MLLPSNTVAMQLPYFPAFSTVTFLFCSDFCKKFTVKFSFRHLRFGQGKTQTEGKMQTADCNPEGKMQAKGKMKHL